uniref:Eukaryotic translation initiation factor 3 30 kDa subunit n=1 Tax=Angiostrongylus cantonensis TaxID=6313 RepID=A0A0K0D3W4_ANGCA
MGDNWDDDDFEPEVQSLAPAPPPPVVEAEPVKPDAHVLKPKKVGTFLATRYKAAHYGDMLNKLIQTVAEKCKSIHF